MDWIFKLPAICCLLVNSMFLISILKVLVTILKIFFYLIFIIFFQVLITKLRSKQTAETRQYQKASKALLVLIPLFGLTYLIVPITFAGIFTWHKTLPFIGALWTRRGLWKKDFWSSKSCFTEHSSELIKQNIWHGLKKRILEN